MISFIVGTIEEKRENILVLECGGIGYELTISGTTYETLPLIGERVKILTYLQVREDGISLFGFSTEDERELFNKLISVSGVGPKMAIGVLSGMKISDLLISIAREDTVVLSKIKGLGKKTAERIVLELKDKISPIGFVETEENITFDQTAIDDACEALISLGVPKNDALRLARANATETSTAEEIVANSLRNMGR